jgi:hypothetical protein
MLEINTFIGYGSVLNQFTNRCLESTYLRRKKNIFVAENFIESLAENKYGKHTVYTDGST